MAGLQKLSDVFTDIPAAKNGIPRHQQLRSRAHHIRNRIQRDAAVDFDSEIKSELCARVSECLNLSKR